MPVTPRATVIGGGPSGLMAAETLLDRGIAVDLYDAMPSLGRKLLMAGRGGLNLTHAEPFDTFLTRYGGQRPQLEAAIRSFPPAEQRAWVHGLGIDTFVGSSGRVFPRDFKAAPLLRAWLHRLRAAGLVVHVRHRWIGWADGEPCFDTPQGRVTAQSGATILAVGGGSWPKLGSDGAWTALLPGVVPLRPANCGFDAHWSDHFRDRFAGRPVKSVALSFGGRTVPGEFVITASGIEGGCVYALSAALRDAIATEGTAVAVIDLAPGRDAAGVRQALMRPHGGRSLATHLKRAAGIEGVKAGLLREVLGAGAMADPSRLAGAVKALPLRLVAPRPLVEAISTAGGIDFAGLDGFMLHDRPGIFCAGEMLDWEAPTGGYLLTACLATGRAAGEAAAAWLMAGEPDGARAVGTR